MAESVRLVDPRKVDRNPENPRLVFRQDELDALADSIERQGILVPLTLYEEGKKYRILDGERRWRCALKLGMPQIPAILVDKPDRMTNLMMMFAIHHRRNEWDPLPTAQKLKVLDELYEKRYGRKPKERELAELASLKIGEVRRLKKLLGLPEEYRDLLMSELEKPRTEQQLTVDQVLESSVAAQALRKKDVISEAEEADLRMALVNKFRSGVIDNTVAPRMVSKIARAVQRGDVTTQRARKAALRLINDRTYKVEQAFQDTAADKDREHAIEMLAQRLLERLEEAESDGFQLGQTSLNVFRKLRAVLRKFN